MCACVIEGVWLWPESCQCCCLGLRCCVHKRVGGAGSGEKGSRSTLSLATCHRLLGVPPVLLHSLLAPSMLKQVRKAAGIGARSKVEILAAENDMYVSRTTGEVG